MRLVLMSYFLLMMNIVEGEPSLSHQQSKILIRLVLDPNKCKTVVSNLMTDAYELIKNKEYDKVSRVASDYAAHTYETFLKSSAKSLVNKKLIPISVVISAQGAYANVVGTDRFIHAIDLKALEKEKKFTAHFFEKASTSTSSQNNSIQIQTVMLTPKYFPKDKLELAHRLEESHLQGLLDREAMFNAAKEEGPRIAGTWYSLDERAVEKERFRLDVSSPNNDIYYVTLTMNQKGPNNASFSAVQRLAGKYEPARLKYIFRTTKKEDKHAITTTKPVELSTSTQLLQKGIMILVYNSKLYRLRKGY